MYTKLCGVFLSESKSKKENKIIYLAAFFPNNAGYVYRTKKWAEILRKYNYDVDIATTLSEKEYKKYLSGENINTVGFYIKSMTRRIKQVIKARKYEVVIVRRELLLFNDYGNLFLEKLLFKLNDNVILDFDDDIAFAKKEPKNISGFYSKILMEHSRKFTESLKFYKKYFVGSEYLKNYLLEKVNVDNQQICVIPTCVDYIKYPQKKYSNFTTEKIKLGWIGSNGNLKYLKAILPELIKLNKNYPIELLVISGEKFMEETNFNIKNITWSYSTQIENLMKIDIGLMPLNNTLEDKGKCGFKLIQYMGLGIVSIATDITINKSIISDKQNGYLVSYQFNNWCDVLEEAIKNYGKFGEIGKMARAKIADNYSFKANEEKYLKFISA